MDLAVNHPYSCSDTNFYSHQPEATWDNMSEFLDEYEDADIDKDLIFRWDVHAPDEKGEQYRAEVFIIRQRKGIFAPHLINSMQESDVDRFVALLKKHKARLNEIWQPL